jgi:hypothetical protein
MVDQAVLADQTRRAAIERVVGFHADRCRVSSPEGAQD